MLADDQVLGGHVFNELQVRLLARIQRYVLPADGLRDGARLPGIFLTAEGGEIGLALGGQDKGRPHGVGVSLEGGEV